MGRNDGASGRKQRSSKRDTPRTPKISGPDVDSGLWYEGTPENAPTTRSSGSSSSSSPRPSSQAPQAPSSWERGGSSSSGRSQARGGRRARGEESDEEEDTRGWWERPEERSLQAYAAPALEGWQEERLQLAYASGRRKAQIQELARELGVDRSLVLAWFKEFALRPQSERDAILTARRSEEQARQAAEARGAGRAPQPAEQALPEARGPAAPAAGKKGAEEPTGFIPFYVRKQQGLLDKPRRIKGEVQRTLESVYDRTPFPSAEVIRGLFELHRLPREAALEWFAARRAADGISSSTQKRTGRASLREKDRDIEGAFTGGVDAPPSGRSPAPGPESSSLLAELGGLAAAGGQGAAQQPAEPTVVTLSRRDMALLRSSLPSPTKHKGRQMAEKMGVKTGADTPTTQIGSVQYVAEAASPEQAAQRVRAAWRFRAAAGAGAEGAPAAGRRLRLRGRRTAGGGGGEGAEGSGDEE